jgi:hypothetical protein
MNTNGSSKSPHLIIAAALGAIGGALSVLLARKESREYIRERGAKSLEFLNQAGAIVREHTEELVGKGRELMGGCCASANRADKSASDTKQGDKPEMH